MFSSHCEVAQRLAERLGFKANVVYALGQLYERWDGKGLPKGLKGEAIAPAVLVVTLAQDMVLFHRLGGLDAAVAVARVNAGAAPIRLTWWTPFSRMPGYYALGWSRSLLGGGAGA